MAVVANRGRGPRVLLLEDGARFVLHPGQSRELELADHPVHTAWIASGTLTVSVPEPVAPPPVSTPPPLPAIIEETQHERQHHVGDRPAKRR